MAFGIDTRPKGKLPGKIRESVVEELAQRPGESDIDYRKRLEETANAKGDPSRLPGDFLTQRAEDEAFLKAVEERRSRLRRVLGPRGYGSTIHTSPLGVPGAPPSPALSLLGRA